MRSSNLSRTSVLGLLVLALVLTGCPKSPDTTSTTSSTPSSTPTEMGVTVRLVEGSGTDPEKPELKASGESNHIRWSNETSAERKIHFTVDWPFLEASGDFTVPAGATSAWYTLDPAKVSSGGRPFPYEVDPTLPTSPEEGPDQPEVSGQP